MEEKLRIIEMIKKANITDDFWVDDILDSIENKYAKGYLTAKTEEIGGCLSSEDEGYRDEFLSACEANIWDGR